MKSNQEHFLAASVSCDVQQVLHAVEPRFTSEIPGDFAESDRLYRIHHDVTFVHRVTAALLDVSMRPEANAAPDSPAPDSVAKAFRERH